MYILQCLENNFNPWQFTGTFLLRHREEGNVKWGLGHMSSFQEEKNFVET